jgi:hypothetical protein
MYLKKIVHMTLHVGLSVTYYLKGSMRAYFPTFCVSQEIILLLSRFQVGQRALQIEADLRDAESAMVGTIRPLHLRRSITRP